MKRYLLLMFVLAPLLGFAQQIDANLLQGNWLLSDIQSKDSIWVAISPDVQAPATSKANAGPVEQKKMSVADYMLKDLACGITRFEFAKGTFRFYRQGELTFEGTYKVKGGKLTLAYNNGSSTKENTVITLTDDKLVLGSESKEKPVTLTFVKK